MLSSSEIIKIAQNSSLYKTGCINGKFKYNMLKTQHDNCIIHENIHNAEFTKLLGSIINSSENLIWRKIHFHSYTLLYNKMCANRFLNFHYKKGNLDIFVKGSSAYMLLYEKMKKELPHETDNAFQNIDIDNIKSSDFDIEVIVNPFLSDTEFHQIRKSIMITVHQTLSLHKKLLDHMFFLETSNDDIRQKLMSDDDIKHFQKNICENMKHKDFLPIFEDQKARNLSSRQSFIICPASTSNMSVYVEIPYFPEQCDKIILRKTPFVCSHNDLDFMDNDNKRKFSLLRCKLGGMKINKENVRVEVKLKIDSEEHIQLTLNYVFEYQKCNAELIDISIPDKDDINLQQLWKKNVDGKVEKTYKVIPITDEITDMTLHVLDIPSCMEELSKMLTLYTSLEQKKEKRMNMWKAFQNILTYIDDKNRQEKLAITHFPPL